MPSKRRRGNKRTNKRGRQIMPVASIPRSLRLDLTKSRLRYPSTLSSNSAGIVTYNYSLGTVITALADFIDFANVYDRFTIEAATVTIFPIINTNASTIFPVIVGYINDGVVGAPSSVAAVLALSQAAMINPKLSETYGVKFHFNPKPTLDPWVGTSAQTSAQLLQYGGLLFYSAGNTVSQPLWQIVVQADVVFKDKY